MPFSCRYYPPTSLRKSRTCDYYNVIAMQDHNYCTFKIYTHYLTWDVARLLWIGFYNNTQNKNCLIDSLPKDLLKHILRFFGGIKNKDDNMSVYV